MDLRLNNLSVELSGKKILESINLYIKEGELVSLLGASGCGKSTMLKTIAGIIPQIEGSVIIGGNVVDSLAAHKRKAVIVFQDFRLFPHMTVAENISFPLKMSGYSKTECTRQALELLRKVKLSGYENRYVDELSGGQIQRIALARAIAAEPSVLLLDEPFSSLDVNLRKDMRDLVLELQREYKITTILVTHDHEEALTMSDRIAFLYNGQIEQYDTPLNIFTNPKSTLVADYFTDGVYLNGHIKNNTFFSDFFEIDLQRSDGKCKCLIRPLAVKAIKSDIGDFKVVEKVYRGDTYLLKLNKLAHDLTLESIALDSTDIIEGDMVNIKLDEKKLIFISN